MRSAGRRRRLCPRSSSGLRLIARGCGTRGRRCSSAARTCRHRGRARNCTQTPPRGEQSASAGPCSTNQSAQLSSNIPAAKSHVHWTRWTRARSRIEMEDVGKGKSGKRSSRCVLSPPGLSLLPSPALFSFFSVPSYCCCRPDAVRLLGTLLPSFLLLPSHSQHGPPATARPHNRTSRHATPIRSGRGSSPRGRRQRTTPIPPPKLDPTRRRLSLNLRPTPPFLQLRLSSPNDLRIR